MSTENILLLLGLILSALVALGGAIATLVYIVRKFTSMELSMEMFRRDLIEHKAEFKQFRDDQNHTSGTIIAYLRDRAKVAGKDPHRPEGPLYEENSPMTLTDQGKAAAALYGPILKDLHRIYIKVHQIKGDVKDEDLWTAIQFEFGKWISENVCLTAGLQMGECIEIAIILAKEQAEEK